MNSDPQPVQVFTEAWLPGHDGTLFYTRTYGATNPRALVVFLHGFSEHIGRYEWVHCRCASKGVSVFAYDQRGYGRTALDLSHKSKGSAFGRTSLHAQIFDLEYWLKYLKREYPALPVYALANSMGGALALAFVTRPNSPPAEDTKTLLCGIISSGTLLLQSIVSKPMRYIGGKLSAVVPYLVVDAVIPLEYHTRNEPMRNSLLTDPFVLQKGSFKSLADMLNVGAEIWHTDYKNLPPKLPILFLHGTEDKITSFDAAKQFIDKIDAEDKQFIPFNGAYHELCHEPNGVKERAVDECISWILARVHPLSAQRAE
ncbi:lysophospholipase [Pilatotrama ljubarskyi]|nr:lysophospholipase [Pilatotrama ljubarskyi]